MDRRKRRSLDILPVALLGAQLAIGPGDPAARDGDDGRAQTDKTLEHIVVDAAQLALGRDGVVRGRIPYHDVGIGARGERPFRG